MILGMTLGKNRGPRQSVKFWFFALEIRLNLI